MVANRLNRVRANGHNTSGLAATSNYKLRRKMDSSIPIVGLILSVVGLVMVLSASQFFAADAYDNAYYFFNRQLFFWFAGIAAFFYFLRLPVEELYARRQMFLFITIGLLIAVFIPFLGERIAGVHRWIGWGSLRFQPAEFAKLMLTIYLAGWLAAKGDAVKSPLKGLLPFLGVLTVVTGLVMAEPDMGTSIVLIIISLAIFFAARADVFQFMAIIIVGSLIMLLLVYAAPYRAQRLTVFLNRDRDQTATLGVAYHSHQALIAIGSGGWWGVGFGQGTSKYAYLPESHTDSIFAVIAEELGFVRSSLIIILFLFLGWRGYNVAKRANSRFVQLLAVGISVSLVSQALINLGGMLNVLPLTGVPLPYISYGGSSLIISMASLGLLTNISREVQT